MTKSNTDRMTICLNGIAAKDSYLDWLKEAISTFDSALSDGDFNNNYRRICLTENKATLSHEEIEQFENLLIEASNFLLLSTNCANLNEKLKRQGIAKEVISPVSREKIRFRHSQDNEKMENYITLLYGLFMDVIRLLGAAAMLSINDVSGRRWTPKEDGHGGE